MSKQVNYTTSNVIRFKDRKRKQKYLQLIQPSINVAISVRLPLVAEMLQEFPGTPRIVKKLQNDGNVFGV